MKTRRPGPRLAGTKVTATDGGPAPIIADAAHRDGAAHGVEEVAAEVPADGGEGGPRPQADGRGRGARPRLQQRLELGEWNGGERPDADREEADARIRIGRGELGVTVKACQDTLNWLGDSIAVRGARLERWPVDGPGTATVDVTVSADARRLDLILGLIREKVSNQEVRES